ncbi:MAG: hypothetical protein LBQ54_15430 [Planctomycetaceae bacterium]|jgi:hypothetical protein|nr:hypothetical protein [Planctomycetaceae bacterium]
MTPPILGGHLFPNRHYRIYCVSFKPSNPPPFKINFPLMVQVPFPILCQSCHSRLLVRNQEWIGQILACPKCGSMVLIEAPAGTPSEPQPVPPVLSTPPVLPEAAPEDSGENSDTDSPQPETPQEIPPQPLVRRTAVRSPVQNLLRILIPGLSLSVILIYPVISFLGGSPAQIEKPQLVDVVPTPQNTVPSESVPATETPPVSTEAAETPEGNASETPSDNTPVPPDEPQIAAKPDTSDTPKAEPEGDGTNTGIDEETDEDDGIVVLETPENPAQIVPAMEIDIHKQLQVPIHKIEVPNVPLIDVIRVFSQLVAVPVKLDVDELRARHVSVNTPVTFSLESVTGADVLTAIREKTRLKANFGKGYITLTYPDDEKNRYFEKEYDVSQLAELAEKSLTPEQILQWTSRLITPELWEVHGGQAKIEVRGKNIAVYHHTLGQDQVERFLLALHFMRGLTPKTSLTPEEIAPEALGWDPLCRKITLNYYEPVPLKTILRVLERNRKIRILVDEESLFEVGLSQESKTSVRINNGTVDRILNELLVTLGLTYRIVEEDVIEVTTFEAAAEHPTVELHRYPAPGHDRTPEELLKTIQRVFGQESWTPPSGGTIVIDADSDLFLVRQSQPIQRAIRSWLGELLNARKPLPSSETETPPEEPSESAN